jgi:hypothetical protein
MLSGFFIAIIILYQSAPYGMGCKSFRAEKVHHNGEQAQGQMKKRALHPVI